MPHIAQPYIVPAPSSYATTTSNNDSAVFSMWEHFLDFCKDDPLSVVTVPRKVLTNNPNIVVNQYTGKKRLPLFIRLSHGLHSSEHDSFFSNLEGSNGNAIVSGNTKSSNGALMNTAINQLLILNSTHYPPDFNTQYHSSLSMIGPGKSSSSLSFNLNSVDNASLWSGMLPS